jgi:hypothetical protein
LYNNRKENDMNRLIKIIGTSAATLTTALVFPDLVSADTLTNSVTVYAGPQSVSPGNPIFVTVEATDHSGASLNKMPVTLSYKADGTIKTLTGRLERGLVSFDVPAQTTAGHMTFSATVSDAYSNDAIVAVIAGRPQKLYLTAKSGDTAQSVTLSSEVISDEFGNPISDLSPVIIEWIDQSGLKGRQTVQLSNGRVLLTTQCPVNFEGTLSIRATLGALQFNSPKLNALCVLGEG